MEDKEGNEAAWNEISEIYRIFSNWKPWVFAGTGLLEWVEERKEGWDHG